MHSGPWQLTREKRTPSAARAIEVGSEHSRRARAPHQVGAVLIGHHEQHVRRAGSHLRTPSSGSADILTSSPPQERLPSTMVATGRRLRFVRGRGSRIRVLKPTQGRNGIGIRVGRIDHSAVAFITAKFPRQSEPPNPALFVASIVTLVIGSSHSMSNTRSTWSTGRRRASWRCRRSRRSPWYARGRTPARVANRRQ